MKTNEAEEHENSNEQKSHDTDERVEANALNEAQIERRSDLKRIQLAARQRTPHHPCRMTSFAAGPFDLC